MEKTFKKLILEEIRLLKSIQVYFQKNPTMDSFFKNITSKNPLQDIILVLYFFFGFGEKV